MKAEIITKFKCPSCRSIHDEENEAERCCPPDEVYVCSLCEEWFPNSRAALKHLKQPHGSELILPDDIYADMLVFTDMHPIDARRIAEAKGTGDENYVQPIFGASR